MKDLMLGIFNYLIGGVRAMTSTVVGAAVDLFAGSGAVTVGLPALQWARS